MATIKDVAKEAGVSVASVSRFTNNKGYVSEDAKKRIERAINKLNYRPNEIARSLFQKKTNMVGLIIPDISNPFFPMLARGVEDYLVEQNYQMVLGNTANDPQREIQYYQSFQQHNFAGIITAVEPFADNKVTVPLIQVDRADKESSFFVRSDHRLGGELVAEAVIRTNPQHVLVMKGPSEIYNVFQKNQAIQQAFEDHEISYEALDVNTFGLEEISQLVRQVMSVVEEGRCDTIVATNDIHAIYIMKEALSRGISIPDELQIVGYDGIDFAELLVPQLLTVKQPVYEMGSLAAEMLLNKIEEKKNKGQQVSLPVMLSEGQTIRK